MSSSHCHLSPSGHNVSSRVLSHYRDCADVSGKLTCCPGCTGALKHPHPNTGLKRRVGSSGNSIISTVPHRGSKQRGQCELLKATAETGGCKLGPDKREMDLMSITEKFLSHVIWIRKALMPQADALKAFSLLSLLPGNSPVLYNFTQLLQKKTG